MNVKNNIKKVSAVLASAALVATTITAAAAYDLSDYPAPFVENGVANAAIVVGANAATQDVIGAIDIAASLQSEAKSVAGTGGSTVTVVGGEDFDELELNANAFASTQTLKESKLEGFVDTDTSFNDEDIDYHDELILASGASIKPVTSVDGEEDFDGDIYVQVLEDAIKYRVVFDDDIDVDAVSSSEELEFKFLGRTLTVTDIGEDNTSMTVEASAEYYMQEGDTVSIDGHDVTLVRVGASSVLVSVDGQTLAVGSESNDGAEEFDQADDFQVDVESSFYIEGADDNSATLRLGADLTESADSDNSAEMFGQPKEEREADWLWDINFGTPGSQYVGLTLNIDREDLDIVDDEDRAALAIGEDIVLPNNYAALEFSGLETSVYETLTITVDDDISKLSNGDGLETSNAKGLVFETDGDFLVVDGIETSTVWVLQNGTDYMQIWYEDGDEEFYDASESSFQLKIDSEIITINPPANVTQTVDLSNNTRAWNMTFPGTSEVFRFWADADNDYFGAEDEDEAGEFTIDGTSFGTKDYDIVSDYGVIISEPQAQFGSGNELVLSIPSEQQKVTLVVKSSGSVVSSSATGSSYNVNPIALGLGMLDTDAPALGSKPMIIVGGPAANTVAAEFMGNPTAEEIAETFSEGRALIQYNDDNMAMLVAGWGAMETQGAANVVAKYGNYDFMGTELEVVVTDLSDIQVNSVN